MSTDAFATTIKRAWWMHPLLGVRDREHGIEGDYKAMQQNGVHELRLVVTTEDYDRALHFYRDVLGLKERAAFASGGGHVTILEAGRATLELTDSAHAEFIDKVEVGRRVARSE